MYSSTTLATRTLAEVVCHQFTVLLILAENARVVYFFFAYAIPSFTNFSCATSSFKNRSRSFIDLSYTGSTTNILSML